MNDGEKRPMTLAERWDAWKLVKMASRGIGNPIRYEVPEDAAVRIWKVGRRRWFEVRATRNADGKCWLYWLAADGGGYRGAFEDDVR